MKIDTAMEAQILGEILQWSAISAERRKSERDFQAEKDGGSGYVFLNIAVLPARPPNALKHPP
jgi:hypothetical protein